MVGLGGLEPPTSPLSGARSSHLSYRPIPEDNFEILAGTMHTVQLLPLSDGSPMGHRGVNYWTNPTFGVGPPSGASLMDPNCAS